MKLSIEPNYYGFGDMFKNNYIGLDEGITILVGCNGSGKTTIINQIEDQLHTSDDTKCFVYKNTVDGGAIGLQSSLDLSDVGLTALLATSSEGEAVGIHISKIMRTIGSFVSSHKCVKNIVVCIDGADSGTSIDAIERLKHALQFIGNDIKDHFNIKTYFVLSANSYALVENQVCYDVQNSEYVSFCSYRDYKEFIMRSYKQKMERNIKWDHDEENKKNNNKNHGLND